MQKFNSYLCFSIGLLISCSFGYSSWANSNHEDSNALAQIFQEEQEFLKSQSIEIPHKPLLAADFSGALQDGAITKLSAYQNQLVFLNFWATWCIPCLKELPAMEKLHQEFGKQGLVILAVGMGETVEKVSDFMKKRKLTMPMMADPDMKITQQYGVQNLPTTYLIDPKGFIFARAIGPREWDNSGFLKYFSGKAVSLKR